jgi:hypothetical protein
MEKYSPNTNNYDQVGLTEAEVLSSVDSTRSNLEQILKKGSNMMGFSDVIYLNSSDPVEKLNDSLLSLKDRRVVTVAGSGEFMQIFLRRHAKDLEIIDVSSPGLFYNELKLEALRNLDFSEYRRLFDSGNELFDRKLYLKISNSLSAQARTYFDHLLKPENFALFKKGNISRERPTKSKVDTIELMRDLVEDEETYKELQKGALGANVSFGLKDAVYRSKEEKSVDLVYLSNVPEVTFNYNLITDFLRHGTRRIMCTLDASQNEDGQVCIPTMKKGDQYVKPGELFDLEGVNARLFAYDSDILFSAIIEVRSEDNLQITPA